MKGEPVVSRREFDSLALRVDRIDNHGTRHSSEGIGPLSVQLAEVIKDVNEVRSDLRETRREVEERFDKHAEQHDRDQARQASSRRIAIGWAVALVASIDGPLLTVMLTRR